MLISATPLTLTAQQAMDVAASQHRPGMISRALSTVFGGDPGGARTPDARLMYCPLYIAITLATFNRPLMSASNMNVALVVDGWRGETSLALGFPDTSQIECDEDQIVPTQISPEQAGELALQEAERFMIRRRRKVPKLRLLGMELVYKPNWVVRCEMGNSGHYRVIDAETGIVVYRYDIEMEQLKQRVRAIVDL